MKSEESDEHEKAPLPGTPEFDEYSDCQGQQAMDRALAMPIVRIFFGLLCVSFVVLFVDILVALIAERRWWDFALRLLFVVVVGGPILLEIGSVALFGRSRIPWFRALMNRWCSRRLPLRSGRRRAGVALGNHGSVMAVATSDLRQMSWRSVRRRATLALVIAACPLLLAGMVFQPGWADGWPFGISKHMVFAAFLTMLFAVAVTSLVTAALLVICYLAEVLTKKPYVGWVSFAALVTIALVFVLGACLRVYQAVHADIVRGWP